MKKITLATALLSIQFCFSNADNNEITHKSKKKDARAEIEATDGTHFASSSSIQEDNQETEIFEIVESAVTSIQTILENDRRLAPKFLRLAFHDCVGGCDGCVDLTSEDNNGLDVPINALTSLVASHETSQTGLSRADIWALSAITAANFASTKSDDFFKFQYYGRTNCEDTGEICLGNVGQNVGCSATTGPVRPMPTVNADTEDVLDFFNDEFGFTDQETVALLGVHTIGVASKTNSGFEGSDGWTTHNDVLDNGYYKEITGNSDDVFNNVANWRQKKINNLIIADRIQWGRETSSGKNLMMLNSDIALVRTYGDHLDEITGKISCEFKNENACAPAKTISQMEIYRNSNSQWLDDFKMVLQKMLVHGYSHVGCSSPDCLYEVVVLDPSLPPNSNCRFIDKSKKYLIHLLKRWIDEKL